VKALASTGNSFARSATEAALRILRGQHLLLDFLLPFSASCTSFMFDGRTQCKTDFVDDNLLRTVEHNPLGFLRGYQDPQHPHFLAAMFVVVLSINMHLFTTKWV
jgi:hypothetical protein